MDNETLLSELAAVLKERGPLWIPASGFSMGKKWQSADALEVAAASASEVQRFDVVVYNRGDVWVAHRIVRVTEDGFETMGDAMWHTDRKLVKPDQVVGRVLALRFGELEVELERGLTFSEWAKFALMSLVKRVRT